MEAEAGPRHLLQTAAHDEQDDAVKPLMVRIKRKRVQPPIESLWLEVSERPTKRLEAELLAFSLNNPEVKTPEKAVEGKQSRLLFHHVDTVSSFGKEEMTRVNTLLKEYYTRSGMERHQNRVKSKVDPHKKYLRAAREQHHALASKARFEQVWRSRKGVKKPDTLSELFHLYDIVRIDTEAETLEKHQRDYNAAENRLLQDFLPLFKEYLPSVMENFAMSSQTEKRGSEDEYVYDVYALEDDADGREEDELDCPMIKVVDEEEYAWGVSSESDYDSEDSNDERNPLNDYPEEEDESDEEIGSNAPGSESDDEKQSVQSDASSEGYGGDVLLEESKDGWVSAGYDSSEEWR